MRLRLQDKVLVGTMVCYFEWDADLHDEDIHQTEDGDEEPESKCRRTQEPRSNKSKSGRESIESFVVVFLCFLIWSLEAEGFVIPTGSMAPTLMGRHKEIACPAVRLSLHGQRRP